MENLQKIKSSSEKHAIKIVIVAVIFYIAIFSFISLWKYYNFEYNALDLAIINQVFYNSSNGDFFASSIHPPSYLGDHFTPIIFLLLPIYYFFRSPQTLLILQSVFLGLCAWPIYLITKKILDKSWAVLLALAWLANPFVQNINLFEFHFLPLAIIFIFFAFYFYQQKKFLPFIIFAFMALLVREDVPLVIAMFGVIAWLQKRRLKWWLVPILLSALYFIVSIEITNTFAAESQYKFFIYYSWLGDNLQEALKTLLTKPWLVPLYLIRPVNLVFAIALLLPLVLLPLLAPFYLLLAAGIFAQLGLGSSGGSETLLQTHYSSLLLPAVFIAAIYGLKKIIANQNSSNKAIKLINKYKILAFEVFIVSLIYSMIMLGPLAGSYKKIFQTTNAQINQGNRQLLKQIPANAAVASTYKALTSLSGRKNIYSFNYVFLGKQQFLSQDYFLPLDTKYLIIDFNDLATYKIQYGSNPFYEQHYQKVRFNLPKILESFGLIEIRNGTGIFKRDVENKFSLLAFSEPNSTTEQKINDELIFWGSRIDDNRYQFWWQVGSLSKLYFLKITYQSGLTKYIPLGYGLLTEEHIDKKIQTNYWFATSPRKIEVVDLISGGIRLSPIRSTENIIDKEKILAEIFSL